MVDNDCCMIAEIGVRMAKNSGETKELAGVPDTCTDVRMALVVTKMVDAGAEETGGTECSNYF